MKAVEFEGTEPMSKHVAVLMGGWASERPVSLRSGEACAKGAAAGARTDLGAKDVGVANHAKGTAQNTNQSEIINRNNHWQ